MKKFVLLAGILAALATGLMADKCVLGDVSNGNQPTDTSQ
jgi:hypothetical protein